MQIQVCVCVFACVLLIDNKIAYRAELLNFLYYSLSMNRYVSYS